ncbi:MAG TPA: exosome complex protein Rrp42 [Euryarchaeota archaeon]|nr:MAG: RNA-binding protein [Thermococci archaeon]RLF97101.1 MAG: RNA-binding protein [Thermococci archaeon]HDI10210.1 exosome complex protein Rrp42 [Euryarchaeota archaeon]
MGKVINLVKEELISDVRRDYILRLLENDKRIDGRRLDEGRDVEIEVGVIRKAEGSAKVKLGDTQVLVGVKLEIGEPFPDSPNRGVLTTSTELLPVASPVFEPGPPNEDAIELARVIDRGIRSSEAVDLESLCIIEGEKVWVLFIDIHVLDDDGNIMDASSIASIAALYDTKVPKTLVENGKVEILDEYEPLTVRKTPISVTIAKVGNKLVLDPNHEEELVMDSRITVTLSEENEVCSIQKGGSGTISERDVLESLEIARNRFKEVKEAISEVISRRGD